MPTLDVALLCSSWAGADQGHESGLVWGALSIGFPHSQVEFNIFGRRDNQKFEDGKIICQIVKNSLICDQNGDRVPRNNKVAIFAVFDLKVFLYDMNNMWFCLWISIVMSVSHRTIILWQINNAHFLKMRSQNFLFKAYLTFNLLIWILCSLL